MAKKNSYLRGLTRAAYNAMQRYNRLAREDEKATLSPGKIKASARAAGITPFEWIRNAEEANLGPRVSAKVQRQIEAVHRVEKKAGKTPTSTAAIRRSIAEKKSRNKAKAESAKQEGRKLRRKMNAAEDVLASLEAKALDIVHPSSVAWMAGLAAQLTANITARTIRNYVSGNRYTTNKALKGPAYQLIKDQLYDFQSQLERGEFESLAEKNAADQAIANDFEMHLIEVDMKVANRRRK